MIWFKLGALVYQDILVNMNQTRFLIFSCILLPILVSASNFTEAALECTEDGSGSDASYYDDAEYGYEDYSSPALSEDEQEGKEVKEEKKYPAVSIYDSELTRKFENELSKDRYAGLKNSHAKAMESNLISLSNNLKQASKAECLNLIVNEAVRMFVIDAEISWDENEFTLCELFLDVCHACDVIDKISRNLARHSLTIAHDLRVEKEDPLLVLMGKVHSQVAFNRIIEKAPDSDSLLKLFDYCVKIDHLEFVKKLLNSDINFTTHP